MANRGIGFFDNRGQFFRNAQEATHSDLAAMLGRMGDGDSLAPGIAKILLTKRCEIEQIFREYDEMMHDAPVASGDAAQVERRTREPASQSVDASNVMPINPAKFA